MCPQGAHITRPYSILEKWKEMPKQMLGRELKTNVIVHVKVWSVNTMSGLLNLYYHSYFSHEAMLCRHYIIIEDHIHLWSGFYSIIKNTNIEA